MRQHVDFLPVPDPLLRDPALEFTVELPVVGIATRFETNSRYVREVIEEAFGVWRGAPGAPGGGSLVLRVRLVVYAGGEGIEPGAPIRHICPDPSRVLVHSPGGLAVVDPERREAVAYVSTALAGDRVHFRREFLETIVLALVTHFDRHPIHAAAIGRERTVLLAGPSGSGKSTLAYLAHQAGLGVLSEEIVWVQQEPGFRLWGLPRRAHLLPEAAEFFPELRDPDAIVETTSQGKIAVDLTGEGGVRRFTTDDATVCLLHRGPGPPRLERLAPEIVAEALRRELAAGFDRHPGRLEPSIAALTKGGGWWLKLSEDPREALPFLRQMLER